jgi:DNA-directed RNA polymerase I, II, and III subunit RPABC2
MSEEIEDIDFKDKDENKSDDETIIDDDDELDVLENSDEEDDEQEDDEQEDDEQEYDIQEDDEEENDVQEVNEEYYEEDNIEEYEKDVYKTNDTISDSDSDSDNSDNEDVTNEIQFTQKYKEEYIRNIHPSLINNSNIEIDNKLNILKSYDESCGFTKINDDNHRTLPYLTKYEKAKILGQRAIQINEGCVPFVDVEDEIIDGYTIAMRELEEKKIPFIIKRPLPNGECEFWRLEDLEQI